MVNVQYLRNLCIGNVSRSEQQSISSPFAEVQLHSTLRFAQIGAVTGFVIGHFIGMYRARKCKSSLMTTSALLSAKKAKHWMLGSIVISVPVSYGYFRIRQYEYNDFYDRAYRLRGNRYQNRIDRASILGALCGGLLMLKRKRFCDGIALGMVNGLLLMILYNVFVWRKEQRILFEKMQSENGELQNDMNLQTMISNLTK